MAVDNVSEVGGAPALQRDDGSEASGVMQIGGDDASIGAPSPMAGNGETG